VGPGERQGARGSGAAAGARGPRQRARGRRGRPGGAVRASMRAPHGGPRGAGPHLGGVHNLVLLALALAIAAAAAAAATATAAAAAPALAAVAAAAARVGGATRPPSLGARPARLLLLPPAGGAPRGQAGPTRDPAARHDGPASALTAAEGYRRHLSCIWGGAGGIGRSARTTGREKAPDQCPGRTCRRPGPAAGRVMLAPDSRILWGPQPPGWVPPRGDLLARGPRRGGRRAGRWTDWRL
jgi:hypothetical protein